MLHEVLKAALSNASLGPTELSRRSGVPIATVFRLLNGTNDNPKLETLARIAKHVCIGITFRNIVCYERMPAG